MVWTGGSGTGESYEAPDPRIRGASFPGRAAVSDELPGALRRAALHQVGAGVRALRLLFHEFHPAGLVSGTGGGDPGGASQGERWAGRVLMAAPGRSGAGGGGALRAANRLGWGPVLRRERKRCPSGGELD